MSLKKRQTDAAIYTKQHRKGVPEARSSCWETPVNKRRACSLHSARQRVSWLQWSTADIGHELTVMT